jgi:hypothetical protein
MLDENQVKEASEHLSSCDACRKEYNELKETLELLGQAEMIPVPDEFSFRLKKALKEEKGNRIDEGLIARTPKKKSRWRIITSIAAVFAVVILSYGFYDNVMGNLPIFHNGAEQAGSNTTTEMTHEKIAAMKDQAGSDSYGGSAQADESSDGSVVMKNQETGPQPVMADAADSNTAGDTQIENSQNKEIRNETADAGSAQTYGAAVGAEPNGGDQLSDEAAPQEAVSEAEGYGGEFALKSNMVSTQEDLSRSLNGSGLERNSAAVQYYNKQIEERLSGFDYQVLETTYTQTGEWQFRIFIFRGKDGNTYNEEIKIIGKNGKIETICSNDFMGL